MAALPSKVALPPESVPRMSLSPHQVCKLCLLSFQCVFHKKNGFIWPKTRWETSILRVIIVVRQSAVVVSVDSHYNQPDQEASSVTCKVLFVMCLPMMAMFCFVWEELTLVFVQQLLWKVIEVWFWYSPVTTMPTLCDSYMLTCLLSSY